MDTPQLIDRLTDALEEARREAVAGRERLKRGEAVNGTAALVRIENAMKDALREAREHQRSVA